jgi:hypothetical protein
VEVKTKLTKWRKRLIWAENRTFFTEHEKDLAHDWNTCAVGEGLGLKKSDVGYHNLLPSGTDKELITLGARFYNFAVLKDNFQKGWEILEKIETRLRALAEK